MRWDAIRGSRAIARRAHTQEFEDFGIGDLRFSIGLVGIDHVVRHAERLGKFVNGNPTRAFSLPAFGKLFGLFAIGAFVTGGRKDRHTTDAKGV